jgi:hypothetical protein
VVYPYAVTEIAESDVKGSGVTWFLHKGQVAALPRKVRIDRGGWKRQVGRCRSGSSRTSPAYPVRKAELEGYAGGAEG